LMLHPPQQVPSAAVAAACTGVHMKASMWLRVVAAAAAAGGVLVAQRGQQMGGIVLTLTRHPGVACAGHPPSRLGLCSNLAQMQTIVPV
jgi:hypothetical protein